MPVEKFRSLDEARDALRARAATVPLGQRLRALHALSDYFSPHCVLPGVTKFRSIEDANRAREEQERSQTRKRPGAES